MPFFFSNCEILGSFSRFAEDSNLLDIMLCQCAGNSRRFGGLQCLYFHSNGVQKDWLNLKKRQDLFTQRHGVTRQKTLHT